MDAKKIGNAIKILRKEIGYTQHQLAECLSVTDKAVSKWERGLSVPDISLIMQLSLLLNIDIDNLLEGNIRYIEESWYGLLIIKEESNGICAGTQLYDKPLVYILLSYFMLVGIKNIMIECSLKDKAFIKEHLEDGKNIGLHISFKDEYCKNMLPNKNIMLVYDNPFVYGNNLTKYFQRAMSRSNGVTMIVAKKNQKDFLQLPILFFPQNYINYLENQNISQSLLDANLLLTEPMGLGMIYGFINNYNTINDFSNLIRFLQENSGNQIYDIKEIAESRNLI